MNKWASVTWATCPGGVSSAVTPELLPASQFAWGYNQAVRGGKSHTRPPFVELPCGLPPGLHQCSSYFGVQGGMIVTSIGGNLFRIRIGENIYSWEPIPLTFRNSGVLNQAWMQQTVETLVIQDGQSTPILYNGSTARRAGATEVPRGRQMAYGNGRLWVAINKNELVAGDIRQRAPGSELFFTETNYLAGGGALFFSRGITGLEFIPITGAADFGTLIVFGSDYAESIRADVTTRDQWGMPGFVTNVFRDIGAAGDWSIVQVNQDLYWRDSNGNIRSLANSISTNNSPGSTPVSREVSRIVGFDSDSLLPWVSSIYFNNRLLQTASPYLNISGGVSFRNLVSLDFSPISTMQGKLPPAYDGAWAGIPGIAQVVTGQFNGVNRAFVISSDEEAVNRIWEIFPEGAGRDDISLSCGSGIITETRIESFIETPAINFGVDKQRKRLMRCDVWLSGIDGELDLKVYWRPDNTQQWTQWDDGADVCAKTTDASVDTPHTWKNLLTQDRPQIKTFTIPDALDAVSKYALQQGFYHQLRVVWTGKCRIEKVMLHAQYDDDSDYREELPTECIENDVTGNEINYIIPTSGGFLNVSPRDILVITSEIDGATVPSSQDYVLRNYSEIPFDWSVTSSVAWLSTDTPGGSLEPGQSTTVTITVDTTGLEQGDYNGTLTFSNTTNMCGDTDVPVQLTVTGEFSPVITFVQYDGPFVYPACMPTFADRYYRTETLSGENRIKYVPIAGGILDRLCYYGDPPGVAGIVSTQWGGSVTWNMDCSRTGDVTVRLQREGYLGAYDIQGVPGTVVNLTGSSMDNLFTQLAVSDLRAGFYSEIYGEYFSPDDNAVIRNWSSPDVPVGYFSGQFGGVYDNVYCQGYTTISEFTNPVTVDDLGTPVARSGPFGSPAWTQTTHSFDGTTRTNDGNYSRALITVPVDISHAQLTGEFTFHVIPDVGTPYDLTVLKDYPITVSPVTGFVDYPLIADAVITLTDWFFSYQISIMETFESYPVGEYFSLDASSSWHFPATFDAPPPNTDCWDSLEDYPSIAPTQITNQPYGQRWNGVGLFVGVDYADCYDDFESYSAGTYLSGLSQGVGWNGAAGLGIANYLDASDDFESYTAGTITTLDFKNFNNLWNGDGSFLVVDYINAWDDFESYVTGVITVFNFTSTDNAWNGDGRAV